MSTPILEKQAVSGDWPRFLWAGCLALLVLACYWRVVERTGSLLVFSEDMAHGLFAPLMAAYVVWTKLPVLRRGVSRASPWGLPILLLGAAGAIISTAGESTSLGRISLLISLAGVVMIHGGVKLLSELSFPLSLLIFTFPIPSVLYAEITLPLQLLASRLSEFLLELLGYSVFREGNVLQLPHGRMNVVEACSGIRSLVTLSFMAICYAYLFERRTAVRIVVVLAGVPASIILNAFRITVTGILSERDPHLATGLPHEILGWLGLTIGCVIVLLTHQLVKRYTHARS